MNLARLCLSSVAMCLVWTAASAGTWPQFRGEGHDYLPTAERLPHEWSESENIRWSTKVPGQGWASPVVWGDRVFIATAIKEVEGKDTAPPANYRSGRIGKDSVLRWEIHCLDLDTGELLWKQMAVRGNPRVRTHPSNTYASETPVTDGKHVYVYFGMMGMFCYDFDGNLVWKRDFGGYTMKGDWGTGSSPILYNDTVYLQVDSDDDSFLVALDPATGEDKWRIVRDEESSWSTPMIWRNSVRTELVTNADTIRSYDPASGELLWSLRYPGGRASASPTGDADVLYIGNEARSDGGGVLYAIKAGASGDITPAAGESTSAGVLWTLSEGGPQFASPLLYEGFIYILDRQGGRVSCYDAKTGEGAYVSERLPRARSFWASPWAYDGRVFCPDDTGTTHILKPGPKFEVLGGNTLDDKFWSSPAFVDGRMILRGVETIYCIEN